MFPKRKICLFSFLDIVVCERYDPEGGVTLMNNGNVSLLKKDYDSNRLIVLIWPKQRAMHWGYIRL
jgi:hypothetical protein